MVTMCTREVRICAGQGVPAKGKDTVHLRFTILSDVITVVV